MRIVCTSPRAIGVCCNLGMCHGQCSEYLAAWVIPRFEGIDAANSAMHYVDRAVANITPTCQRGHDKQLRQRDARGLG